MPTPESEEVILQATAIVRGEEIGKLTSMKQVINRLNGVVYTQGEIDALFSRGLGLGKAQYSKPETTAERYPRTAEEYDRYKGRREDIVKLTDAVVRACRSIGDERGAQVYELLGNAMMVAREIGQAEIPGKLIRKMASPDDIFVTKRFGKGGTIFK